MENIGKPRHGAYSVVDLFSGVGGLSLGAARAGFEVIGTVDIDPQAIGAHERNFPGTIHLLTDISELNGRSLRDSFNLNNGDLTGIIGGPPCQGFSSIGRRDENDARNKLFAEFFRVVSEALPIFFLAENVPGIMRDKNSALRNSASNYVEDKYVILPPMVMSANEYGAPTTRTRVFFFGFLPDAMEPLTTDSFRPPPDAETVLVKNALIGLPKKINPHWQKEEHSWRIAHVHGNGFYASRLHGHVPLGVGDRIALERLRNESRASGFLGTAHCRKVADRYASIDCGKSDPVSKSYRLDPNGFCPTLRAGTDRDKGSFQAVRPLHPTENRVITPREAARLQGFPDWFQFSPTKWHSFRQIGSSVSPIIAERILTVIRRALGDQRTA
jgi:DNA (cytosine-5)-methyltransferase 1